MKVNLLPRNTSFQNCIVFIRHSPYARYSKNKMSYEDGYMFERQLASVLFNELGTDNQITMQRYLMRPEDHMLQYMFYWGKYEVPGDAYWLRMAYKYKV